MGKIVDYPSQRESLHPMAGMKNIVTIDGTEERFKLSEKAKRSLELAKKAAATVKNKPSFRKKATYVVKNGVVTIRRGNRTITHGLDMPAKVSRGTKP